jgi:hypothetical protein
MLMPHQSVFSTRQLKARLILASAGLVCLYLSGIAASSLPPALEKNRLKKFDGVLTRVQHALSISGNKFLNVRPFCEFEILASNGEKRTIKLDTLASETFCNQSFEGHAARSLFAGYAPAALAIDDQDVLTFDEGIRSIQEKAISLPSAAPYIKLAGTTLVIVAIFLNVIVG